TRGGANTPCEPVRRAPTGQPSHRRPGPWTPSARRRPGLRGKPAAARTPSCKKGCSAAGVSTAPKPEQRRARMQASESAKGGWWIGRRVSWGAILAGAVVTMMVMAAVWFIGFGLVGLVASPASFQGAGIALFVLAIAAPIIGGLLG